MIYKIKLKAHTVTKLRHYAETFNSSAFGRPATSYLGILNSVSIPHDELNVSLT